VVQKEPQIIGTLALRRVDGENHVVVRHFAIEHRWPADIMNGSVWLNGGVKNDIGHVSEMEFAIAKFQISVVVSWT
jgi:hypothetical protein